jgi:hypothetical protein
MLRSDGPCSAIGSGQARFAPVGIEALRTMAANRKQLPPDQCGHLIQELQQL